MAEYVPSQAQRDLAETLSGYGIPQDDIARLVGVSLMTLHKHFREELDVGMAKANAFVAANMFKMATGDGPHAGRMAMFWAKARMGWREVPQESVVTVRTEDASVDDRARALAHVLAKRGANDERGRTH
jgi:hypothetical protein